MNFKNLIDIHCPETKHDFGKSVKRSISIKNWIKNEFKCSDIIPKTIFEVINKKSGVSLNDKIQQITRNIDILGENSNENPYKNIFEMNTNFEHLLLEAILEHSDNFNDILGEIDKENNFKTFYKNTNEKYFESKHFLKINENYDTETSIDNLLYGFLKFYNIISDDNNSKFCDIIQNFFS